MPVLKEWTCRNEDCAQPFEAIISTCPRCGHRNAKRAFRTPVGINGGYHTSGSAKRIDAVLEREFAKQGISNFSNTRSENKVTWARRVNAFSPGRYATHPHISGAPAQQPIQAFMGRPGDFSPLERSGEYGFQKGQFLEPLPFAGAPGSTPTEMIPTVDQGGAIGAVDMVQVAQQTPLPAALSRNTERLRRHT